MIRPFKAARQNGVALLSMLLVLVIVTAVSTQMIKSNRLEIQRAQMLARSMQERVISLAGLQLAVNRLTGAAQINKVTNITLETGSVSVAIADDQGKFNINNLLMDNGEIETRQLAVFVQLLNALNLEVDIAQTVADWLDADISARAFNSEDLGYLQKQPAYRTANGLISHISELRLLANVSSTAYERLQPFVTALPANGVPININSASGEVLTALLPGVDSHAVVRAREIKLFQSVDDFLQHQATAGVEVPQFMAAKIDRYLTVESTFYVARADVKLHSDTYSWQALIRRNFENMNKGNRAGPSTVSSVEVLWQRKMAFWEQ